VDEAIRKAGVLIEALGWIRRFRGKYVVIKLGGSALEEEQAVRNFLTDVIFLETVGMKPILVHGGGKAITKAMNESGIEPRFVHGRRYTDDATLEIVARVLATEICASLVDEIRRQGGKAAGLSFATENVLIAERLTSLEASDSQHSTLNSQLVDLGHVGHVVDLNRELLDQILASETIPVLPSVGMTRDGQKLNINADTAAAAVARLLKAEKLVFLSDVPGIFPKRVESGELRVESKDSDSQLSTLNSQHFRHLDAAGCRDLIADGTIDAGMIPKVEAALEALQAGVGKVHLVDARMPHSVLLEIYSNVGVGTEIVR
jgi:acetylglutamate kinase